MTKQPALIAARPTTSHADVILSRDKQNVYASSDSMCTRGST
jgi:hypothetical protein